MSYAYAKELDPKKIPIIDVSTLRDGTDKISVSKKLHEANKNLGFLYVSNHGISNKTINKTREYGLQFFNKNTKEKETVKISKKHRGWLGYGGAQMEDDAKADLKESFLWGYQDKNGKSLTTISEDGQSSPSTPRNLRLEPVYRQRFRLRKRTGSFAFSWLQVLRFFLPSR